MREGSTETGTVATTASDVYMLGGLAYELLTAGTAPFHWLARNRQLLTERLTSSEPVDNGTHVVPGLLRQNVLQAARLDGKAVPWCVQPAVARGSAQRLDKLKNILESCLALDAAERPRVSELHRRVSDLLAAELTWAG